MLWLILLVLMLLIAAAPGISIYVKHRAKIDASPESPGAPISAEPRADGQRQAA